MIPKRIHYCWFGRNPLPEKAKKCIASWKRFCPDYEIIQWNEDNINLHANGYLEMCVRESKWAFLSDYVRLAVVEQHGGIYFDVDVELLRPMDDLLHNQAYFGFETPKYVNTGLGFGAEAGNPVVRQMLTEYDPLLEGNSGVIGCPTLNTQALVKCGLRQDGTMQHLAHVAVYPPDYFNPYDDPTGRLNVTENTYSIHWYFKSPHGKITILRSKIMRPLHRILGTNFFRKHSR